MNFFKSLFSRIQPVPNLGANIDNRPEEEKAKDIHFHDIVASAAPVDWKDFDLSKLPEWPVLNQNGASACVAFTKALMSTMVYFARTGVLVVFSPKWIYNFRSNKGQEGMIGVDAFDIEATQGLIPEALMPSENLTEVQINTFTAEPWLKEVGKALRMSDQRVILPKKDIETIASVSQVTGKPIMVWFNFSSGEWGTFPKMNPDVTPTLNHSVTMPAKRKDTDQVFGIYQGEKAIVIQDSWGLNATNLAGKRIVRESFFKQRNLFAAYSMRFRFDESNDPKKPRFDGTIISLQKCLQYEGCFPLNVAFVESFGPVTRKSLAQFQQNHGLPITSTLDQATKSLVKSLYP